MSPSSGSSALKPRHSRGCEPAVVYLKPQTMRGLNGSIASIPKSLSLVRFAFNSGHRSREPQRLSFAKS